MQERFEQKIWLSSPTMHGEELQYIEQAIRTNKSKNDEERRIPPAAYSSDEEWVQEYIRQFGKEPSFF